MLNNFATRIEDLKLDLHFTVKEEGDTEHHCNIVALQHLNMLDGGCLTIRGLQRVKDPKDAEKANLKDMHGLKLGLELIWDGDELGDKDVAAAVFQCLQPSVDLVYLKVSGYKGREWPNWMMDNDYKFVTFALANIEDTDFLQKMGPMPHLEVLFIEKVTNLRNIDGVFATQVSLFPSLKEFYIYDMEKLEQVCLPMFPYLRLLEVKNCPSLSSVKTQQPSSVTQLTFRDFEDVETLPNWIGHLSALQELLIKGCPKMESLPNCIKQLPHLRSLTIFGCSEALKEEVASSFPPPSYVRVTEDWLDVFVAQTHN